MQSMTLLCKYLIVGLWILGDVWLSFWCYCNVVVCGFGDCKSNFSSFLYKLFIGWLHLLPASVVAQLLHSLRASMMVICQLYQLLLSLPTNVLVICWLYQMMHILPTSLIVVNWSYQRLHARDVLVMCSYPTLARIRKGLSCGTDDLFGDPTSPRQHIQSQSMKILMFVQLLSQFS